MDFEQSLEKKKGERLVREALWLKKEQRKRPNPYIPHVFSFIERWFCVIVNVTLQFARAAAILELIGQFFLLLHLLKFYVVLALLRFGVLPFVPN